MGLPLPFKTEAMRVARRPSVLPCASTTYHSRLMSLGLVACVLFTVNSFNPDSEFPRVSETLNSLRASGTAPAAAPAPPRKPGRAIPLQHQTAPASSHPARPPATSPQCRAPYDTKSRLLPVPPTQRELRSDTRLAASAA